MKHIYTIIIFLAIAGCDSRGNSGSHPQRQLTGDRAESKLGLNVTTTLTEMLNNYYGLKDALVADDAKDADAYAARLATSAKKLRTNINNDSIEIAIIAPFIDTIEDYTNKLIAIKDESCEYKRIEFEKISDAVYLLIKKSELKNTTTYRQYCPMAFNDKGAYWLSNTEEINNPYFGKKMKECGEITETIK